VKKLKYSYFKDTEVNLSIYRGYFLTKLIVRIYNFFLGDSRSILGEIWLTKLERLINSTRRNSTEGGQKLKRNVRILLII